MAKSIETIKKYSKPTPLDLYPQKTIWEEISEDGTNKFYIQCSPVATESKWISFGDLLEYSFKHRITDSGFINELCNINPDQLKLFK